MELVHVRLVVLALKSMPIKLNVCSVLLDFILVMILFVNNVLLVPIPLTLEPLFALSVDVDLKPMKQALVVNYVVQVHTVLMMANVNYVLRMKYLIL